MWVPSCLCKHNVATNCTADRTAHNLYTYEKYFKLFWMIATFVYTIQIFTNACDYRTTYKDDMNRVLQ